MKTETRGKIISISGATVRTDLAGLTLFERVSVGEHKLNGEVARLEKHETVLQVYEDPSGLGLDEPVQGHGDSLTTSASRGLCKPSNIRDSRPGPSVVVSESP